MKAYVLRDPDHWAIRWAVFVPHANGDSVKVASYAHRSNAIAHAARLNQAKETTK